MKKGMVSILSGIVGAGLGALGIGYVLKSESHLHDEKIQKFKNYYMLLNQWMILKNENKSLAEYFKKNEYRTVAIYGMGELGSRLIEELLGSDIIIKYAIDINTSGAYMGINAVHIDDTLEQVDVVVVTATFAFSEVEKQLKKRILADIVSLEDVVFEA